MYSPELVQEEQRIQRSSALLTAIISILLLLGSMAWWAFRKTVPPPGEEYEVVGAIDFGDLKTGSKQVNNLERATEKPAETPPKPVSKPVQAPPAETQPPKEEVITQEEVAPVETPKPEKPDPKPTPPKPVETVKPSPKPVEKTENNTEKEPVESQPEKKPERKPLTDDFGSNQGDKEDGVGNQGSPAQKQLDPNGLFSFGQGVGGGSNQRAPLHLPPPAYNAQEEGVLTFEFTILPDGRVGTVKLVGLVDPSQAQIRRAGENAIRKWKFTALKPNQPQTALKTTVTITFKLR